MTTTSYFNATTGTYYAKPLNADLSPWSTGIVTFAAVSGYPTRYDATTDDTKEYAVHRQAGASPASTDSVVGQIGKNELTAVLAAIAAVAAQVTTVDTVVDANAAAIAAVGSDLDIDGYTLEEAMRIALSALAGKATGGSTTTNVFNAADDSKARITATVDRNGNRSAITLDAT